MFVLRRLAAIALLTAILSVALFALLAVMPERRGDADWAGVQRVERAPEPWTRRYRCWLVGGADCRLATRGLLRGDLGYSTAFRAPVATVLGPRMRHSVLLLGPALAAAFVLAIALGTYAARRPDGVGARVFGGATLIGLGTPKHWAALVVLLAVQSTLGLTALERAPLLWPWLVLTTFYGAAWARYVRRSMRDALVSPHVRLARAKGLPEWRVVIRHAMPGALIPFVAVVSPSIPVVFSGSVLVESVFSYPGMGLMILEALRAADHATAVTVFLIYAVFTFLVSLGADFTYRALDPRVAL